MAWFYASKSIRSNLILFPNAVSPVRHGSLRARQNKLKYVKEMYAFDSTRRKCDVETEDVLSIFYPSYQDG